MRAALEFLGFRLDEDYRLNQGPSGVEVRQRKA